MDGNSRICRLYTLTRSGRLIADPNYLTTFYRPQIAHDIRSPVTVADDTKSKHRSSPYKADVLTQKFTGELQRTGCKESLTRVRSGSRIVANRRRPRSSLPLESAARS